jgi:hypothetical protein
MDPRLRERLSKLGPIRPIEKPEVSGPTLTLTFEPLVDVGSIQSIAAIMGLYRRTGLNLRDAKRLIEDVLASHTATEEVHFVNLPSLTRELAEAGVKLTVG